MARRTHISIYRSGRHLAITIVLVTLPFLFFMFFSRLVYFSPTTLLKEVFVSSLRLVIAYSIAAILAWVCAVSFYRGRRALVALPIFDVLQSFPTFAALPLVAFFWGVSNFTVILFLVLTIIWPIFFSMVSSLKLVKHEWEEAVEMSRLSGFAYLI